MGARWQTLAVCCVVVLATFTVVVWRAQKTGGACRDSNSYLCNLISSTSLPTDYLALTAIGGIFVAIFTLKSIKESSDAAKDAADAAKKNIGLLIAKERARVRVDSVNIRLVGGGVRQKGLPREADRIEFEVFCVGATDAFILEGGTCSFLNDSAKAGEGEVTFCGIDLPKVLAPGKQAIKRAEGIEACIDGLMERAGTLPNAETSSFLHFAVFVRYRDIFQTSSQWRVESKYVWKMTYRASEDGGYFAWTEYKSRVTEQEEEGPS